MEILHIIVDILVVVTLAFCAWQGYKRGIIGSILAVLFIILSAYGANLVANAFAHEFEPMFRPFIAGHLDGVEADVVERVAPPDMEGFSVSDLISADPRLEEDLVEQIFYSIGIHESRAAPFIERHMDTRLDGVSGFTETLADILVEIFCFMLVYIIAFLLILIALTVIYNIIHLSFRLPGLKLVDGIGGGVFGFLQGLLLIFMLTFGLGVVGIILPEGFLEDTAILEFFVRRNPMTGFMGM